MARRIHPQSYGYGTSPERLVLNSEHDQEPPSHRMSKVLRSRDSFIDGGITLNGELINVSDLPNIPDVPEKVTKTETVFDSMVGTDEMIELEQRIDTKYGIGKYAMSTQAQLDEHYGGSAIDRRVPTGSGIYRSGGRKPKHQH